MKNIKKALSKEGGGLRGGLLLWLIGVPLPVILLISLFRGCS